jgi:hypothetical protein
LKPARTSNSKTRSTPEKSDPAPPSATRESDDDSASDDASHFERPSRTGVRVNLIKTEIKPELPQEQARASAFAYVPLKPGEFRILVLQHGRKEDMVVCSFLPATITEYTGKYEAISYLWGRGGPVSQASVEIELRDSEVPPRARRIFIKSSLSTALRSLRHRSEIRYFWVDALCIDRTGNTDEPNQQVAMRREIFYHAKNLCFWLGEEPAFKMAFNFIPKILDLAKIDKLVRDENSIEDWEAFITLLKSPMFTRLWLVQEVAVAQNVTLHSGQPAIHYHDFVDAVAMFVSCRAAIADLFRRNKKPYRGLSDRNITIAERFIDVATNALREPNSSIVCSDSSGLQRLLTLESLVSQLSDLTTGNPRDRIFSMLALAKDTTSEPTLTDGHQSASFANSLRIDYSRSTMEVYQDFVIHTIDKSKSLDIICRRWANSVPEDELKYPTWIQPSLQPSPDNNSSERTDADALVGLPGHNNYSACKSKTVELPLKSLSLNGKRKSLLVTGFAIDTIAKLGPRCSEGIIQYEWLELGDCTSTLNNTTSDSVPEAFWRTLVADRSPNGSNAPSWYQRALLYCLVQSSPNGDINTNKIIIQSEVEAPLIVEFLRRVQSVVWNRKFLVSESKKLIGLAPMTAQVGDIICIIYGCSVPVVLRKHVLGEQISWSFIGECYIHGMMDGEAMEMDSSQVKRQEVEFILS